MIARILIPYLGETGQRTFNLDAPLQATRRSGSGTRRARRRYQPGCGQDVAAEKDKVSSTMVQASLTRQPLDHLPGGGGPPSPPQAMGLDVQAHLGRQLRAVFDDLAKQPVPDRFLKLLDALESKSAETPAGDAAPATTAHGPKAGDA